MEEDPSPIIGCAPNAATPPTEGNNGGGRAEEGPSSSAAAATTAVNGSSTTTTADGGALPASSSSTTSSSNPPIDVDAQMGDRLALLQELYQRKHAELLAQMQQQQQSQSIAAQDYLQNLQLLQLHSAGTAVSTAAGASTTSSAAPINSSPVSVAAASAIPAHRHHHPYLAALRQTSSEQSTDDPSSDMQSGKDGCGGGGGGGGSRNRRTFSGSGSGISQTTRDRLKTMIATKKQKQRLHSSCSTGSATNVSSSGSSTAAASALTNSSSATNCWVPPPPPHNHANHSSVGHGASGTHFEPYPHPSPVTANNNGGADFQLRKVNSEPNLKMRIRARLLNKGSSPVTAHPQQQQRDESMSTGTPASAVSAAPAGSTPLEMLLKSTALLQQQHDLTAVLAAHLTAQVQAASAPNTSGSLNMMIPSPSLPNLCGMLSSSSDLHRQATGANSMGGGGGQSSADQYANLMLQASTFASFLSMPSLLRTSPLFQPSSLLTEPFTHQHNQHHNNQLVDSSGIGGGGGQRASVKFADQRLSGGGSGGGSGSGSGGVGGLPAPSLPIGGYPSLLKQQLRDLVLRRKSLVREEPEEHELQTDPSTGGGEGQSSSQDIWQQQSAALQHALQQQQQQQLKTGLAYDPAMSKHQCLCGENHNHVEHGGRVQSIWSRLQESGLVANCERVPVKKAPLELLRLAHSATYVTFFAVSPTACLKMDPSELPLRSFVQLPCGGIGVDTDTYFNDSSTQTAIRVAVGLLVELCGQVVEGRLRNGFACIRPPGHHAEREQAMGFCFFNNVSIAVRYLQQKFPGTCRRIAIIDWDVHHGNGSQLCFEADPQVLYISLHRHDNGNFFPGTGAVTEVGIGEGKGFTVNIPFSGDVMGDAEYLAAWRVLVLPLLDAFQPQFILVSAGFDAAKGHPAALGGYELSPQLFGHLTHTLMPYANGRVVLALEGGYDLPSICESAEECVKALCSEERATGDGTPNPSSVEITSRLSSEALEKVPNQAAQEAIQKVIAIHKNHWPCLTGIQGINTSELHWNTISKRFSSLTVHS